MFIADSYSSRTNKGTHKAIRRLRSFTRKVYQTHGRCWALKCDVKKLFASIDHDLLLQTIKRHVLHPHIRWLTKQIVDSFHSTIGTNKGVPIGNLTSQLFANIYLNDLDQFLKHDQRVRLYLRYTDDFVIIHKSSDYLFDLRATINNFLRQHLNLTLHPQKVHLRKLQQGIDFLGYVVLPNAIVLRTKLKRRIIKKVRTRLAQLKRGEITEETFLGSLHSYRGVLTHANTHGLRQKLDEIAGIVL